MNETIKQIVTKEFILNYTMLTLLVQIPFTIKIFKFPMISLSETFEKFVTV